MGGMYEGGSDVLYKEWAGESRVEREGAREGSIGGTGSGGIHAELRKDRGINKAGGGGSTTVGDPEEEDGRRRHLLGT